MSDTTTATPTPASRFHDIISALSSDLEHVDLQRIQKDLKAALNIQDERIIYDQLAKSCAQKALLHPQWSLLAGRLMSYEVKTIVPSTFSAATLALSKQLLPDYVEFVEKNATFLDAIVDPKRDYTFDSFAMATARHSYLTKRKNERGEKVIAETMQYLYMRVATFCWMPNLERIARCYNDMSLGYYTPASPTFFNAGKVRHQLASCFLLSVGDTMQDISKSWHDTATISMNKGGIGLDFSRLRHSEIEGSGCDSAGIMPWLKIQNEIIKSVNQSGMRKGSATINLRVCHVDIEEFIEARKGDGADAMRARDLFYCVVLDDLFMKRVKEDAMWSLFCPNKAKGLFTTWGLEYEHLYTQYESKKMYSRQVKARNVWRKLILAQCETGMPFMLHVDAMNRKNNQRNKGYIGQTNLCTEVTIYTDDNEIGSCNLSSIALSKCVRISRDGTYFDFDLLETLARQVTRNLNQVIDRNYYPTDVPQIKYANLKNRPLGIGVQGLADAFAMLDISWAVSADGNSTKGLVINPVAANLNRAIFETIYYASVSESVEMAKESGAYESFAGSPASKGLFQFDLWDIEKIEKEALERPLDVALEVITRMKRENTSRYTSDKWETLRKDMVKYGRRNSLLVALMPTASTASMLGNNEAFEPYTQNIYARTVLSGQHMIINKHMVKDLQDIGMWNIDTIKSIIKSNGSVQSLTSSDDKQSPRLDYLKLKYLTAFEIPQRVTLQMMLERGRFVCQSQSFNCFMKDPDYTKLNAFHFAAWQGGAVTGMYYLRQPAAIDPLNVSLDGLFTDATLVREPPPVGSFSVETSTTISRVPEKTPTVVKEWKCDDHSCCT